MSTTDKRPLRIGAIGDLHVREQPHGEYRGFFAKASKRADVLLLCGDLTQMGLVAEAENLASDLSSCSIPVLGVLGNHDHQSGQGDEIKKILKAAKMVLLEDGPYEYEGVGFAGVKGFCGGFGRHMLTSFGEDAIKTFVTEALNESLKLENSLRTLNNDRIVVALHYSPVAGTLEGEPLEIFPFLGSSRLAEAIDLFDVSAVFHGHAHHGAPEGKTNKGTPVYNCCYEIMSKMNEDQPFAVIEL
jgi:Icc-related predicted phosphoesterase